MLSRRLSSGTFKVADASIMPVVAADAAATSGDRRRPHQKLAAARAELRGFRQQSSRPRLGQLLERHSAVATRRPPPPGANDGSDSTDSPPAEDGLTARLADGAADSPAWQRAAARLMLMDDRLNAAAARITASSPATPARQPAAADDDDSLPLTASPPLVAAIPDDAAAMRVALREAKAAGAREAEAARAEAAEARRQAEEALAALEAARPQCLLEGG